MTMMMKRAIQAWELRQVHNQQIFQMTGSVRYVALIRLISTPYRKTGS